VLGFHVIFLLCLIVNISHLNYLNYHCVPCKKERTPFWILSGHTSHWSLAGFKINYNLRWTTTQHIVLHNYKSLTLFWRNLFPLFSHSSLLFLFITPPSTWWQLVWGVCADMLVFTKLDAVHCGQASSLWSHLSKGHCSRSLVVCSDATLLLHLCEWFWIPKEAIRVY